jgi:hypothetical protein
MIRRLLVVAIAALFVAGCGGSKYSDVKDVMNTQMDIMEKFASSVDKASNGQEIADAINEYTGEMETHIKDIKALSEKYPELKDNKEPPAELKEMNEKMQETSKKFAGAIVKISMKYRGDPAVAKALKEMGNVLQGMR